MAGKIESLCRVFGESADCGRLAGVIAAKDFMACVALKSNMEEL